MQCLQRGKVEPSVKRRVILIVAVLLLLTIPTWSTYRAVQHQRANSALIQSIKANNTDAALAALDAGADANTRDIGDSPPGVRELLEQMIDRLRGRKKSGDVAYHAPALLVLTGIHFEDGRLQAPPENTRILASLLQHGANPNVTDNEGFPPLLWSIRMERVESARLLIGAGAGVNAHDESGLTPLTWGFASKEMIRLLMASHADFNCVDPAGKTALDYAQRRQNAEDTVKLLRQAGAKTGIELAAHPRRK